MGLPFAIFRKVLAAPKPIRAPQCISSVESTSVEAGVGGVGGRDVTAFSWMSTVSTDIVNVNDLLIFLTSYGDSCN